MFNWITYFFNKTYQSLVYLARYKTIKPIQGIIFKKQKLIYIPIPKCGNTAIKESFSNLLKNPADIPFEYAVHEIEFPLITIGRKLPKKYLDEWYTIFIVIREPLERLISCYYSKYHLDKEKIKNNTFRTDAWKRKMDFSDYLFWYLRKDPGNVENFLKKIIKIPTMLMEAHFIPVSNYIRVNKNQLDKLIITDLNNLEHAFNPIIIKWGLPKLKIRNKTEQNKTAIIQNLPKSLVKKIRQKYRDDYRLLEYLEKKTNKKIGH